jgi:hypothetical protein
LYICNKYDGISPPGGCRTPRCRGLGFRSASSFCRPDISALGRSGFVGGECASVVGVGFSGAKAAVDVEGGVVFVPGENAEAFVVGIARTFGFARKKRVVAVVVALG